MPEPLAGRDVPRPKIYDFYLGVDFGPTRTNVSFLNRDRDDAAWSADMLEIEDVGEWNPRFNRLPKVQGRQVPTQSLYVPKQDGTVDVFYGYEAEARASGPRGPDEMGTPIHIFDTKPVNGYPAPGTDWNMNQLKRWGMIQEDDDVEINFMTWTLKHVKKVLTEQAEGLTVDSEVYMNIGCPVAWTQRDRRRFKGNVAKAAARVRLGSVFSRNQGSAVELDDGTLSYEIQDCDDMRNLIVLTETEAAGLYLASNSKAKRLATLPGSTIVAGDIGGGTSDFSSFRLSHGQEYRIEEQICPSSGCPDGMQKLNENLRGLARDILTGHPDLVRPNMNLESIIEEDIIRKFEDMIKPTFSGKGPTYFRTVLSLSAQHGVPEEHQFLVSEKDMREQVFLPVLESIETNFRNQLLLVRQMDPDVSTIWLYGGGANKPMLRSHLEDNVLEQEDQQDWDLHAKVKLDLSGTFVSKGLAYAAANPTYVPKRYNSTNYGFIQDIPVGPRGLLTKKEASTRGEVAQLDADGDWYLTNAVRYFMTSGQTYGPETSFDPFEQVYTFYDHEEEWTAKFTVVLHDGVASQFYPITHQKNSGSQVVDILHCHDLKPLLKPYTKGPEKVHFEGQKRWPYHIRSTIQPKMSGLDLVLEVRLSTEIVGDAFECQDCRSRDVTSQVKQNERCIECQEPFGTLFRTEIDVSTAYPLGATFGPQAPETSSMSQSRHDTLQPQASSAGHNRDGIQNQSLRGVQANTPIVLLEGPVREKDFSFSFRDNHTAAEKGTTCAVSGVWWFPEVVIILTMA
ncbi:hypothetical protein K491DRAFT_757597 [Lophiostoma macrostomum CBS 122681]|uniref:Actin-like ATPase domain-containing protein n=1 Tax=Lophiostoma macrostomum CBS 122681 TaxID=1314788 RepID=A0A6A6T967_9PLEO|nr:hypothetical protein K491DRAFT_757597 [Lophiostoma macrostomum CBS 122681]